MFSAAVSARLGGGVPFQFYETAVKGFAVANLPPAAVRALAAHPMVRLVEEDGLLDPHDVQVLPLDSYSYQASSLWALDRIDEHPPNFNGQFEYFYRGTGVHIYIVDTGVRCGHEEFAGRIGEGVTRLSWSWGANPCIDQDGHGTRGAGAAAATTYGVAKGAIVHSVRINDNGTAYTSDIIAGLDWIAANAIHPAVANLSYGSAPSEFSLRDALEGVVNSGVVMVKSAGNSNIDAFEDRANRAAGAIIVGASDRYDYRADFGDGRASNYGSTVSLFAPGLYVRTTTHLSDNSVGDGHGTSIAAPVVTGVAAAFLEQEPGASSFRARDVLRNSATANALGDVGPGSPNLLVFSQFRTVSLVGPTYINSDYGATYSWGA